MRRFLAPALAAAVLAAGCGSGDGAWRTNPERSQGWGLVTDTGRPSQVGGRLAVGQPGERRCGYPHLPPRTGAFGCCLAYRPNQARTHPARGSLVAELAVLVVAAEGCLQRVRTDPKVGQDVDANDSVQSLHDIG